MIGTCPPGALSPQRQLPAENCVPASSVAQIQLKRMGDGPVGGHCCESRPGWSKALSAAHSCKQNKGRKARKTKPCSLQQARASYQLICQAAQPLGCIPAT